MAELVGGFVLPHEPGVFASVEPDPTGGRERVRRAFETVRDRIGALGATSVVIVGADHYVLFGPTCLPSYLIAVGDVSGPYERFPGLGQGPIPNDVRLAEHLFRSGREQGFDWAVAKSLTVDHSIGGPARLCALPNPSVRGVVPIYLASGVEPLLPLRRAFELGRMIGRAIADFPEPERVVVIGSGGISHWVGLPEMGRVEPAFDRMVLDCVTRGTPEPLLSLTDAQAGNGALEIRSFLCAMGALGCAKGRVIDYVHGPQWVTGLGFAEIEAGT